MPPSDDSLKDFAAEHIVYEFDQLLFAAGELTKTPPGPLKNALIESFTLHVRCLENFIWRDSGQYKHDSFAVHFCDPARWDEARKKLLRPALDRVENDKRLGREIMHLTYKRIAGEEEAKLWDIGALTAEMGAAVKAFVETARSSALEDETRAILSGAVSTSTPTIDTANATRLQSLSATGMAHQAGTLSYRREDDPSRS